MTQVGISIGGIGAPLLVGAMSGWRSPFFVCAALGLAWIPVWMLVRRTVRPCAEVAPQRQPGVLQLIRDPRLMLLRDRQHSVDGHLHPVVELDHGLSGA